MRLIYVVFFSCTIFTVVCFTHLTKSVFVFKGYTSKRTKKMRCQLPLNDTVAQGSAKLALVQLKKRPEGRFIYYRHLKESCVVSIQGLAIVTFVDVKLI